MTVVDEIAAELIRALQLDLGIQKGAGGGVERVPVLLIVEHDRSERGRNADAKQETQQ